MEKSYVKLMLDQEQIIAKVGNNKYFKGISDSLFTYTDNENEAYVFKCDRDQFIETIMLLNAEFNKQVKLYRKDKSEFVELEVYNQFIIAEMHVMSNKLGEKFQEDYTNFMKNAKFKLSFNIDGNKMYLKQYPDNVKTKDALKRFLTKDIDEAIICTFESLAKNDKIDDIENLSDNFINIIKTVDFDFIHKPSPMINEGFRFAFYKGLQLKISEVMKTR